MSTPGRNDSRLEVFTALLSRMVAPSWSNEAVGGQSSKIFDCAEAMLKIMQKQHPEPAKGKDLRIVLLSVV